MSGRKELKCLSGDDLLKEGRGLDPLSYIKSRLGTKQRSKLVNNNKIT